MKRLFVLCAAVFALGFNACEKHSAEDLPAEFRGGDKHAAPAPATSEKSASH